MRLRLWTALAIATTVVTSAATLAGAASTTPVQLYNSILATGNAQKSVEWSSSGSVGTTHLKVTSFASASDGYQDILLTVKGVAHKETVRLVKNVAYLYGDSSILTTYMGFSKTQAKKHANQWIAIESNNADFIAVTSGLTLSTAMTELSLSPPVTQLANRVVNGESVIVLKGKTPTSGSSTSFSEVLLADAKTLLPVKASVTYQGATQSISFAHWGLKVKVAAPKNSTPFSTSWLSEG
ncbi:MAG: hypothetical protein ACRDV0_01400 [Acidimicrobiales bacterium]